MTVYVGSLGEAVGAIVKGLFVLTKSAVLGR